VGLYHPGSLEVGLDVERLDLESSRLCRMVPGFGVETLDQRNDRNDDDIIGSDVRKVEFGTIC